MSRGSGGTAGCGASPHLPISGTPGRAHRALRLDHGHDVVGRGVRLALARLVGVWCMAAGQHTVGALPRQLGCPRHSTAPAAAPQYSPTTLMPERACLEDEARGVHDGQVGRVRKLGAHHNGLRPRSRWGAAQGGWHGKGLALCGRQQASSARAPSAPLPRPAAHLAAHGGAQLAQVHLGALANGLGDRGLRDDLAGRRMQHLGYRRGRLPALKQGLPHLRPPPTNTRHPPRHTRRCPPPAGGSAAPAPTGRAPSARSAGAACPSRWR